MSSNVLTMGFFYVALVYDGVLHRGINLGMSEELLYLFYGHSFVDGAGGHGSSEFMWVNSFYLRLSSEVPETDFYAADFQADVWCVECYEKGFIVIGSHCEILLQMNLCLGVEVDFSFFVSFSENDAFAFVEVNVFSVEAHQLADADAG